MDFVILEYKVAEKAFKRARDAERRMNGTGRLSDYTYIMEKMFDSVVGIAKQCAEEDNPYFESNEERFKRQKAELEGFEKVYDKIQEMRGMRSSTDT